MNISKKQLKDAEGIFVIAWILFFCDHESFAKFIKWNNKMNSSNFWNNIKFSDHSIEDMLKHTKGI